MTSGPYIQPHPPPDSLWSAPARARRTDPVTSKLAAEQINRSGKAAADKAIVLDVLRAHPLSTYRELSQHIIGIETTDIMKRLCDLEAEGLVEKVKGRKRLCGVGGKLCSVWRVK